MASVVWNTVVCVIKLEEEEEKEEKEGALLVLCEVFLRDTIQGHQGGPTISFCYHNSLLPVSPFSPDIQRFNNQTRNLLSGKHAK